MVVLTFINNISLNISNMNFFMNRMGLGLGFLGGKKTRVVAAAAATAAVVVSAVGFYKRYKVREQMKENQKRLKQEQESAFEYKYFKEYDELADDDPNAPVPASHIHVRETTPQGDVIMTYDADRAMFCYYCDKRSVQFKYLESVARKYVIEHGCKRLYIDIRKEMTKAYKSEEKQEKQERQEKQEKPSATKSVFAQFKKYGLNPVAKNASQPVVLKEQVTRYWYCGRLDEFNLNPAADTATTHDFSIIKPIDYASYKKMNSS